MAIVSRLLSKIIVQSRGQSADYKLYYDDPYHGGWTTSRIGTPDEHPDVYAKAAPMSHVDQIQHPLLIDPFLRCAAGRVGPSQFAPRRLAPRGPQLHEHLREHTGDSRPCSRRMTTASRPVT